MQFQFILRTKTAASNAIFGKCMDLLQKVNSFPVRPEYQVWIYRNYGTVQL